MLCEVKNLTFVIPHVTCVEFDNSNLKAYIKLLDDKQIISFDNKTEFVEFRNKMTELLDNFIILKYRDLIIVVPHITRLEIDMNKRFVYLKLINDKQIFKFDTTESLLDFKMKLEEQLKKYYMNF